MWVSSLVGSVYEVDAIKAEMNGSLEAGIIRKFAGEYSQICHDNGFLWGLDLKAKRICKIKIN